MTAPLSDQQLAAWASRLTEITEGPWLVADGEHGQPVIYIERESSDGRTSALPLLAGAAATEADVQFIAHSPERIAALLADNARLRALAAEMTRCRDNALSALHRDDVETDPHLPSVAADAITGMNFDWDDERVVQDIADTVAAALQPAFGKLTQERDRLRTELERQDGEARFWEFEYQEAMDNYKGESQQVGKLRAELEQARTPIHDNATRALDYLAALDTSHMSTDAIGLGLHIVAMLDGPGDPTAPPACTCAAEPVHQAGCPGA